VINLETSTAKRLSEPNLNANMGHAINWLADDSAILATVLPKDRPELIKTDHAIPSGPTISTNDGKKAQNRTYQDLLKNKNDEFNFQVLASSEIWKFDLDGQMYEDLQMSPDGQFVLVSTVHRPFSYIVPYYRFPTSYDVYDLSGQLISNFHHSPLLEDLPKGFMSTRTGPRRISWRSDRPSTLFWVEALDGGDPEVEVEYRDALYEQAVPFDEPKRELMKTKYRFGGVTWGHDNLAVCYNYWWNSRNLRTEFFDPSDNTEPPILYNERNYQDRYSDPGDLVTKRNQYGRNVLAQVDGALFLLGDGYSDKGIHPFVDRLDPESGTTERLYQAEENDKLERLMRAINIERGVILTRLESKNEYPNYYFRNIFKDKLKKISNNQNPFETIQNVEKKVVTYKRDDGLDLSATLYLPVGYDEEKKEKLPMLMWAYPVEHKDKSTAGQVTTSPNEFTFPWYGSPIFWVNRGYVVLDDAAFPIVGEGDDEPNDSFRKQLVANAKAAIDAVDEMGYIDRTRVGVGGHSYGAFMTANLLSHSDLFAAGIARSGAYNRTLTPFGFQSEERNYWEAPDIYNTMSPFMHADKMKTPLLLVHGEADNNSGTYPMQSERYFNALKGLGATVRLVMLPKESHGYAARESILHMLWEQDQWLEKYVKNRHVIEEVEP
jgi:dipeptidyl aminopeptidase/acylaminoacyl peptidase